MMYLSDWLVISMLCSLFAFLLSGLPVGFVLGGIGVVFGLIAWVLGEFSLIEFYNIAPRIWGGLASNLILVAAPMFILMGILLDKSGIAGDLLRSLSRSMRRVPGGLAISVVLVGTILAASTGIVGASVVLLTLLTLPTMLKAGYSPELATGTIAASGTLGIVIPPSIMLIVIADLMSISVGSVFFGALVPGVIASLLYVAYIMGFASIWPEKAPRAEIEDEVEPGSLLSTLVAPLVLVFAVLGSILFGWATPTEAAGVGAATTFLIALLKRRLTYRIFRESLDETSRTIAFVFFVFLGATVFSYVFRSLGGDDLVLRTIEGTGASAWGVLATLLGLAFLLGFFFDWIEISLILLPIFGPVFEIMDFGSHVHMTDQLVWIAVLFSLVLQTSFLTPPFAFSLFFLRSAAPPEVTLGQLYRGAIPFVVIQVAIIVGALAFPDAVLALPTWMFR